MSAITQFLDAPESHRMMQRLRPASTPEQLRQALIWACWTTLVEPGDGDAGALIAALGAEAALQFAESANPQTAHEELTERAASASKQSSLPHEPRDWQAALSRWRPRLDAVRIRALLHGAYSVGARFTFRDDLGWPAAIDDLGIHAPLGLWVRGDLGVVGTAPINVALVGSRASSAYGDSVAGELAAAASDAGIAVVSGGAYGIDAQAHRVTLASNGVTIAVLAGGVDRLYPAGNRDLLERIIASGAVISELPCGTAPTRWRFLQRNRLIAALTQATVLVEAGARSGAMNTANHALTLGRAVGAVPGPITSSTSVGCHRLLREHQAELISGPSDLLALCADAAAPTLFGTNPLADVVAAASTQPAAVTNERGSVSGRHSAGATGRGARNGTGALIDSGALDTRLVRTLDALTLRSGRTLNDLVTRSGLSAADLRAGLAELELLGHATQQAGKWRRCA
ncbi:DNA-processing protein DprA [Gulosibacter bifidus]|uniref:DNA-processing protein DprA n=1 Tax=Gulosibacter bifidus TaxID=272239 RepID=A0ABW5RI30_9MICO|nr:DNA-processing protein DprA [Gulosibacter bifidus]